MHRMLHPYNPFYIRYCTQYGKSLYIQCNMSHYMCCNLLR